MYFVLYCNMLFFGDVYREFFGGILGDLFWEWPPPQYIAQMAGRTAGLGETASNATSKGFFIVKNCREISIFSQLLEMQNPLKNMFLSNPAEP